MTITFCLICLASKIPFRDDRLAAAFIWGLSLDNILVWTFIAIKFTTQQP